jgi:predicted dehydrogenase
MDKKVKVGLVGCGVISDIYIENSKKFTSYEIIACADLITEKAQQKAEKWNIPIVCSVDELMRNPEIEVVLNLTIPQAHAEISLKALEAGKHVYCEKPLAVELADGKKIVDLAKKKGLRVGCAPDTFLGGRLQMCRKIIDDGWLGKVIGGSAYMLCPGHEIWHPGPDFYYKKGAGPLFDMAPYYITALLSLLGPVDTISGSAGTTYTKRTIKSEPLRGTSIDVEVPTYIAALLNFKNGAIVNCIFTFDVWDSKLPRLELYGSEGTLSIDDADPYGGPNTFEGAIKYRSKYESDWLGSPVTGIPRRPQATEWPRIPTLFTYNSNSRGVGLADMTTAIMKKRDHRANGDMAYHALEVMQGIYESSRLGAQYHMKSSFKEPALLNPSLPEFVLD